MANLIIKSSADDLVLQGSDASPSITVGATGTLTFAENVTMSGTANNVGTVTAGTLGSEVSLPYNSRSEVFKMTATYGNTTWATNSLIETFTFTPSQNTSLQIYHISFSHRGQTATEHFYFATKLLRVSDSVVMRDTDEMIGGGQAAPTGTNHNNNLTVTGFSDASLVKDTAYKLEWINLDSSGDMAYAADPTMFDDLNIIIQCFY